MGLPVGWFAWDFCIPWGVPWCWLRALCWIPGPEHTIRSPVEENQPFTSEVRKINQDINALPWG